MILYWLKQQLFSTLDTLLQTVSKLDPFPVFLENRKDSHNHTTLSALWRFTHPQTQKQCFRILKALGTGDLSSFHSDCLALSGFTCMVTQQAEQVVYHTLFTNTFPSFSWLF